MSCLMLLASLRRLLPSRSLLRVGRFFLGATTLNTAVVRGQKTADPLGSTALDGVTAPVDTTGDELGHRGPLGQTRGGRGIDRRLGGRAGRLPALVGCGVPRVARAAAVGAAAVRSDRADRCRVEVPGLRRGGLVRDADRASGLTGREPLRGD